MVFSTLDFMFKGNAVAGGAGVAPESKQRVEFLGALAPPLMAAIVALSPLCNPPGNSSTCPSVMNVCPSENAMVEVKLTNAAALVWLHLLYAFKLTRFNSGLWLLFSIVGVLFLQIMLSLCHGGSIDIILANILWLISRAYC